MLSSSTQVGMDAGLCHPCFFAFFSNLYFYFQILFLHYSTVYIKCVQYMS